MPVSQPPLVALQEFLGETTRHTRRVEIYEADGVTRWAKDKVSRLKTGSVSVDYSRDERRSLDLTLTNDDGVLINAPGEFWYDKIIKVYRGVEVKEQSRLPKVLVVTDDSSQPSLPGAFRAAMISIGYGDVRVNPLANSLSDLIGFDIIVNLSPNNATKNALMVSAYNAGYRVATFGGTLANFGGTTTFGSTAAQGSSVSIGPTTTTILPKNPFHPLGTGWASVSYAYTGSAAFNTTLPLVTSITTPDYTSISNDSNNGYIGAMQKEDRRWFMYHLPAAAGLWTGSATFKRLVEVAFGWLNPVAAIREWEVQIGEFMIDRITEPHFPREVKITGRDYTKKCMNSKFAFATQFTEGIALESIIASIAGAAGITKRSLPTTGVIVGRTFFFERGVSRWEAMKEIANSYNYEIYFDATGFLVIRPYSDPSATAPSLYIETGKKGQIASFEKSTTDSSIYNHIIVTGESSDASVMPVWAEAINNNPLSKTSVLAIGDRLMEVTSAFIRNRTQAQVLADNYLAIHALEEFELTFESLLMPWLEVGDILGFIDPNPAPDDPTTFLLSQITLPLELAPMSANAKRVTIVRSVLE